MLTNKDIEKLVAVFPTKQDFKEVVERVAKVEDSQRQLITAMDRLTKAIEDQTHERAATVMQVTRHDKWIRLIAQKVGVSLV